MEFGFEHDADGPAIYLFAIGMKYFLYISQHKFFTDTNFGTVTVALSVSLQGHHRQRKSAEFNNEMYKNIK